MKNIPVRQISKTKKEPNFSESFSIRDVREVLAGNDMVQELHRHAFYYLLALKKGRGKHEIDFASHDVRDHSVFVMRPGQVHQIVLKAESTGYLVGFNADFYNPYDKVTRQLLRKANRMNCYRLHASQSKKIFLILNEIFHEHTTKQDAYQEAIKANLGILYLELARLQGKSTSKKTNSYAQERAAEFLELLETHISSHKQTSEYANMLNLSAYQLNSITKATLGKTCSDLINDHVVLEAKRYLLATSNQVTQIAFHLGYEDVSYFIRFFKKHTGYSPEAFRHNFG
ncbi:MAG: helix-turn-helix domain-containing protein [Bacteroidota bacterium]